MDKSFYSLYRPQDPDWLRLSWLRFHDHNARGKRMWQITYFSQHICQSYTLYTTLYVGNGEGNGTPLQYSCLENPMDGGAWWAAIPGVAGSQTWLSDFTFTFHFHALEKEMATHSSVLAWRIPGMGEPGGLPSMGSHKVRHDWSDLAAAACRQRTRNI